MTWAFRPFPGGRHGQEQNAPTRPSGRIAALLAVFPFVERVTGIGGVFFRSKDPERLAAWYEEHLGVTPVPLTYEEEAWHSQSGPTVFAAFAEDTDHFGRPQQQWMVNFRVRDLDAMTAQLRRAGIDVEVDEEIYPNGRFARVYDPEGNPVELWEP
ncbi:VOC family protein [Kineosporia succinea]|uniref:Enzyme related to lactoylglutathione lyase n=1 Tax=Kineosporia succinea TaxID=84632 RepID=A0ABT9P374_9ACTN|nr:VOC family protein [Kineosporia succinea]MDP9827138.1 putative enzyme related to lactoylglutathione lyase [Kineosporia succinea]